MRSLLRSGLLALGLAMATLASPFMADDATAKTIHFNTPDEAIWNGFDGHSMKPIKLDAGDTLTINYERAGWLNFSILQHKSIATLGLFSIWAKDGLKEVELYATSFFDKHTNLHYNFGDAGLSDFTVKFKQVIGSVLVGIDGEGYSQHPTTPVDPVEPAPAPVPLPAALPLLLAGLGALGMTRLRRKPALA